MANPEHLKILKQGVKAWNDWREDNPNIIPDLSRSDLRGENLPGANLSRTNIKEAHLKNANLSMANLRRANLRHANLRHANLSQANLSSASGQDANFREANFREANLTGAFIAGATFLDADFTDANLTGAILAVANLSGAALIRADLTRAYLAGASLNMAKLAGAYFEKATLDTTAFSSVDLSSVKGLDTCVHFGPSSLDHLTLMKSGKLPTAFLRGCGLPDALIEYQTSLFTDSSIQFYSCFISYSAKDQEFAERLHGDLQNKGVRCWFAPEDLKTGDKFRQRIDESIILYDKLLLVLSDQSLASQWVESEVESALEKERQKKTSVLFPIRLDNTILDTKQAWAADIRRTRHIGDFSNWKDHDAYKKAFDRLLRDLKDSPAES